MKGEDLEQATLIQWCNLQSCKYSELKLIFAIPNGGYRNKGEARKLKATGTKSGVPDLFLAVPRNNKSGLFFIILLVSVLLTIIVCVIAAKKDVEEYKQMEEAIQTTQENVDEMEDAMQDIRNQTEEGYQELDQQIEDY